MIIMPTPCAFLQLCIAHGCMPCQTGTQDSNLSEERKRSKCFKALQNLIKSESETAEKSSGHTAYIVQGVQKFGRQVSVSKEAVKYERDLGALAPPREVRYRQVIRRHLLHSLRGK